MFVITLDIKHMQHIELFMFACPTFSKFHSLLLLVFVFSLLKVDSHCRHCYKLVSCISIIVLHEIRVNRIKED